MKISTILALASTMLLVAAGCSTHKPVSTVTDAKISVGKTTAEVEKAIELAAKNLGWKITDKKPGLMEATLRVRKHTAIVAIKYDQKTYNIEFKGGENIDYNPERGTVHRNFNKWLNNLDHEIQKQL